MWREAWSNVLCSESLKIQYSAETDISLRINYFVSSAPSENSFHLKIYLISWCATPEDLKSCKIHDFTCTAFTYSSLVCSKDKLLYNWLSLIVTAALRLNSLKDLQTHRKLMTLDSLHSHVSALIISLFNYIMHSHTSLSFKTFLLYCNRFFLSIPQKNYDSEAWNL